MSNFCRDVSFFIDRHKLLCASTFGVAIAIYALGNLAGRAVSWIRKGHGTTSRAAALGQSIQNNPNPTELSPRNLQRRVSTEAPLRAVPETVKSEAISPIGASSSESAAPPQPTRIRCLLPADAKYKAQWKELGITLDESTDSESTDSEDLAECWLPEGWKLRKNLSNDDLEKMTLLDNGGIPRANITIKSTIYDSFAKVSFLSKDEGVLQLEGERKDAEAAKKEDEAAQISLNQVNSQRSESWSESCPHGIFYIKDMRDFILGGYCEANQPVKYYCHGFFPSEEIALQGIGLLQESAGFRDRVFTVKITNSESLQKTHKYEIVNGFSDPDWFKF